MALADLNLTHKWQMDAARKKIDPVIRKLVDRLDDAYYGTPQGNTRQQDGWKHGISHPFFIWDYVAGEDNKLKFDYLSGIIHHLTFLCQHLFNTDEATKYPEAKYNAPVDKEGKRLLRPDGITPLTRVWETKQHIKQIVLAYNAASLTPPLNRVRVKKIIQWIKNRPIVSALRIRRPADTDSILDPEDESDIS